jgi:ArsR family transcriptional regulator
MKNLLTAFKALSDPVRLRLFVLLTRGERCVCDLVEATALPQSTVSRHLSVLKSAGLVVCRRHRNWSFYGIAGPGPSLAADLAQFIASRLKDDPSARADLIRLSSFLDSERRVCGG